MRYSRTNAYIFLKRNSNIIMTGVSIVGFIVTSVSLVKATSKATLAIDELQDEKDEIDIYDKAKLVWKYYKFPIFTGTVTLAVMLSNGVLNQQRQTQLLSAYALLDQGYKQYKDKLKEIYGEEYHERIMNEIAVEQAEDVSITAECLTSNCDLGSYSISPQMLFYDSFSKRYFQSTIEQVIQAEYHLNRNFVLGGYVTLNQFYEFLGIAQLKETEELGWAIEDEFYWIDFNHSKKVVNNEECIVIDYVLYPSLAWSTYEYM